MENNATLKIKIKPFPSESIHEIELPAASTVLDLKTRLSGKLGWATDQIRLIHKTVILSDDQKTFAELELASDDVLRAIKIVKKTVVTQTEAAPQPQPRPQPHMTFAGMDFSNMSESIANETGISSDQAKQIVNNPLFKTMFESLSQNPQFLQQIMSMQASGLTPHNIAENLANLNPSGANPFFASQQPAQGNNNGHSSNKRDQYKDQIKVIKEVLGLGEKDEEKIIEALLVSDGNVENAVNYLMQNKNME